MKKKNIAILGLLSIVFSVFLLSPTELEAQDSPSSSKVSYSFAEKSSVLAEHLQLLKEGVPTEIALADEERYILVYQKQVKNQPPSGSTTEKTEVSSTSVTTDENPKILPKTNESRSHHMVTLLGLGGLVLVGVFLWNHRKSKNIWLFLLLVGMGSASYQSLFIGAETIALKSTVVRFIPKGQAMTYVPEKIEGYDYVGYIYLVPILAEPNQTTSFESTTGQNTTMETNDSTTTTMSTVEEPKTSSMTTIEEQSTSLVLTSTEQPTTSSTTATTNIEPTTSSTTTATIVEPTTSSTTTTTIVEPTTSSTTATTNIELTTSSTTTATIVEPTTSSTTTTTIVEPTTSSTTTTTNEPSPRDKKGKVVVNYYTSKYISGEIVPISDGIKMIGYHTSPYYAPPQIAQSEILEGNIGESYEVHPKQIDGFVLKSFSENVQKGTFSEDKKEIRFYYDPVNNIPPTEGHVKINFVLEDGTRFTLPRYKIGIEGLPYEIDIPELENFEFVKMEGEAKGHYRSDETPELTLTYKDIRNTHITILHLTDQGEELKREVMGGVAGKKYSTEQIYSVYNWFYELSEVEGERKGTFRQEPFTIVYRYQYRFSEGKIPVYYKFEDGSNFYADSREGAVREISGPFGSSYSLEPFIGNQYYELSRVEGELQGTFLPDQKNITLYYRSRPQAKVTVNYFREDGRLITSEVFEGGSGLPYQVEAKVPNDYEGSYVMVRSEGELSGTYDSETPRTISLYFRERQRSSIEIRHVDKFTDELIRNYFRYNFVGNPYESSSLQEPEEYELVEVSGAPVSGVHTETDQTITYYYQRVKQKLQVIHTSNDYFFKENLSRRETIEGKLGDAYSIAPVDHIDYVVDRVENGSLNGEIPYGEQTIYVHYIPNPNRSSITFDFLTVMYSHFDYSLTVRGNVGETYTGPIRQYPNMIYETSDSVDENGKDQFVFKPYHQVISLFYEFTGRVTVKHVYRNHPEYNTEVVLEGRVYTPYSTSPLPREGTIQVEVDGSEQGEFPEPSSDPITITYYYE